MSNPIEKLQRNNFDLIRFVLAMIVVLVHISELSGLQGLRWIGRVLSSTVAVNGFFVVSGFLVFMSFDRSSSLASFAEKRARRLLPAYVVIILLAAFALRAVTTTPAAYFGAEWLRYVSANLVFLNFLHPTLPGVFESNPFQAVNGALWTLKVEVAFYVAVPMIAWLFRFGRAATLTTIYLLSIAWVWIMTSTGHMTLAVQLPGALSFFIAGAAVYYHFGAFQRHVSKVVPVAIAVIVAGMYVPLSPLYPAALGVVVCYFATHLYVGNFGRYGDFSYGLYIVHFPIVQILVEQGAFKESPLAATCAAVGLSLVGSVLMWHLVEKRFLARSSHYVLATRSGGA